MQHSHPAPPGHGTGGGAEWESQEVIVHVFGQPFAQLSVLLAGRSGRPLSEWFPRQDAAFFVCNCAHVAVIRGHALSPFGEEHSQLFWGEVCFSRGGKAKMIVVPPNIPPQAALEKPQECVV